MMLGSNCSPCCGPCRFFCCSDGPTQFTVSVEVLAASGSPWQDPASNPGGGSIVKVPNISVPHLQRSFAFSVSDATLGSPNTTTDTVQYGDNVRVVSTQTAESFDFESLYRCRYTLAFLVYAYGLEYAGGTPIEQIGVELTELRAAIQIDLYKPGFTARGNVVSIVTDANWYGSGNLNVALPLPPGYSPAAWPTNVFSQLRHGLRLADCPQQCTAYKQWPVQTSNPRCLKKQWNGSTVPVPATAECVAPGGTYYDGHLNSLFSPNIIDFGIQSRLMEHAQHPAIVFGNPLP